MTRLGDSDRRLVESLLEESRRNGLIPSDVEFTSTMTSEEQDDFFQQVSALGVPDSTVNDIDSVDDIFVQDSVNPILDGKDDYGNDF